METVPPQSKVGLYAAIRRDSQAGVSGQAWKHRYGCRQRWPRRWRARAAKEVAASRLLLTCTGARRRPRLAAVGQGRVLVEALIASRCISDEELDRLGVFPPRR